MAFFSRNDFCMACLGPFYSVIIHPSGKELTYREEETEQEGDWEGQKEDYPMYAKLHS